MKDRKPLKVLWASLMNSWNGLSQRQRIGIVAGLSVSIGLEVAYIVMWAGFAPAQFFGCARACPTTYKFLMYSLIWAFGGVGSVPVIMKIARPLAHLIAGENPLDKQE